MLKSKVKIEYHMYMHSKVVVESFISVEQMEEGGNEIQDNFIIDFYRTTHQYL